MTKQMTIACATAIARALRSEVVLADRQWSTETIAGYLPDRYRLRDGAEYSGAATISDLASFIRAEAVPA